MRTKNTRTIFGKLTVLAKMRHKKTTTYKYLCQCSCGNEIVATASNLYSGATTSCGCYDKERRKLPVGESMRNLKIYEYKKDAKRRNLIVEDHHIKSDKLLCLMVFSSTMELTE